MRASLVEQGVDLAIVSALLDDGYLTQERIDHHEANPNAEPVVVMMLTEKGRGRDRTCSPLTGPGCRST